MPRWQTHAGLASRVANPGRMDNMDKIKITPESWREDHYKMRWDYKRLDEGTLWNVSKLHNADHGQRADIWTINAWGQIHRDNVPVSLLQEVSQ